LHGAIDLTTPTAPSPALWPGQVLFQLSKKEIVVRNCLFLFLVSLNIVLGCDSSQDSKGHNGRDFISKTVGPDYDMDIDSSGANSTSTPNSTSKKETHISGLSSVTINPTSERNLWGEL